jgi:hypothetical protein
VDTLSTRLRRRFQFHLDPDELPLLENAISRYGSVQQAVVAALHADAAQALLPAAPPFRGTLQPTSDAPGLAKEEPSSAPRPHAAERKRHRDTAPSVSLYTPDAARILGITSEAVRERINRRTLTGRRTETGYWIVNLDRALVRNSGINVTPSAAALLLGLRPATIKKKCKSGVYPGAANDGTGWQIPIQDLL